MYSSLKKEEFPEKLKNISNAPKTLFYIGNKKLFYKDSFAIIGSRKITEYGKNNCIYFAKEFAYRSIPIVSGLAIGADSIAHKTVLENNGETIVVLGHGLKYIYPKENEKLLKSIIKNKGLVVTEYNYNIEPNKKNFPKRNRIISALSDGVLVVEAAYRSGTSITVNYAKKQGKKVFAIPGRLDHYLGIGVNNFIKEGAILTTKIEDIVKYYPQFINKKRIIKSKKIICTIKEEYKEVYLFLNSEERNFQEIAQYTGKSIPEILSLLTNMELEGIIKRKSNGNFFVCNTF